jgi:excisionase family DNA binding protein
MQYYTLEEAARLLGTTPDDVKKMAERNELRPFRDRGSMRFRSQEVEELARRRGRGSDPELQLGEGQKTPPPRKSKVEGAAPPKRKSKLDQGTGSPEVFDFDLPVEDDQVEIGQELNLSGGPSSKKGPGSSPSSSSKKKLGPKSPPPTPGSDSDVRLVGDSGAELDFQLASDSDVKLADDSAGPKSPRTGNKPPGARKDSSVRMVPLEPESASGRSGPLGNSPSDSDVRLDPAPPPKRLSKLGGKKSADNLLTEEIDLDAELKKAEEVSKGKKPRLKPGSAPQLPTTSPFELSEADIGLPEEKPTGVDDSSSDFDLTPAKGDHSPLELGSDEIPAPKVDSDDEVSLGELSPGAGESGINLRDPADSGISLEQQGSEEEIEFELSLDEGSSGKGKGPRTPKPAPPAKSKKDEVDSDSEFELTLDDSSPQEPSSETEETPSDSEFELNVEGGSAADSDSEFELTLDDSMEKPAPDSDSEFELTLDDSGSLPGIEEEEGLEVSGEKDIFETDFEVPALEDESGSQAVALEEDSSDSGDIESSDFDLDIGEGLAEDESGSQVLALDEESADVDDAAATVAKPRKARAGAAVLAPDEAEELLEEDMDFDPEASAARSRSGAVAVAPPAEWGAMPAMVMGFCVIVMFLVGLMGFELVRGMYGYRQGGPVTSIVIDPLARMFTEDLPK